ncbi:class I SAM-dependent RNA methyltransferase [Betaproteobacteria bacterium SCN2]|jgi:putative N6-adenine-specific DNA methylase|nr:class I SAM-dependent RNA methyltransferase [Betaproteobacteria bacterium SCN2]
MTDKRKPRGTLSISREDGEDKPRQAKRPATSRRANIERDRSKKPAPKAVPEPAWQDKPAAEDKPRARPARPQRPTSEPPAPRTKEARRDGGEARRRERPAAAPRADRPDTRPERIEQFFATCPRGLENALADELLELGAENIEKTGGGVGFHGPMTLCYAANLHSRVATRILLRVSAGKYQNEEDVYQGALAVYWHKWFTAARTIAVKVVAQDSPLKSLNFITLRIKDAVCDRFVEETGARPSVQTLQPDIRIRAFLTRDRYTLYLDTSGESLYKRGLRKQSGAAPINENLAAGILKLSGWRADEPLYDPMCGSGTFLMEAAQMALNIAPGLGRDFAFERMLRMDARIWARMKSEAEQACQPVRPLPIYGSDVMGRSLRDADSNLKAAGLREAVTLSKADILDIEPPAESGVLVMNPPYGVRLGEEEELAALYPKLGDVLKNRFANWRAYIISADASLPRLIHLSASRKTPLFNGALECRLYEYKLVAGSNR